MHGFLQVLANLVRARYTQRGSYGLFVIGNRSKYLLNLFADFDAVIEARNDDTAAA